MNKTEELKKGCGEDYLDESGEWELLCGKHIWKDKNTISQLNLCPKCKAELKGRQDALKEVEAELKKRVNNPSGDINCSVEQVFRVIEEVMGELKKEQGE